MSRNTVSHAAAALAVALMATLSQAGDTPAAKDTTAKLAPQSTCPVMGGAINRDLYVDHDGKRIYVCCQGCVAEVKKDPAKYIGVLKGRGEDVETVAPAKALAPQKTCPVMNAPIKKKLFVDHQGKRIYVCCGHCRAEVKKDPEKWIAKLAEMGESVETKK